MCFWYLHRIKRVCRRGRYPARKLKSDALKGGMNMAELGVGAVPRRRKGPHPHRQSERKGLDWANRRRVKGRHPPPRMGKKDKSGYLSLYCIYNRYTEKKIEAK